MSNLNLKFGLNVPIRQTSKQKRAVLFDENEDTPKPSLALSVGTILKTERIHAEALTVDPNIFDYDSSFDSISQVSKFFIESYFLGPQE